jgi:hypothetical protein
LLLQQTIPHVIASSWNIAIPLKSTNKLFILTPEITELTCIYLVCGSIVKPTKPNPTPNHDYPNP